jgi:hypothetical protein
VTQKFEDTFVVKKDPTPLVVIDLMVHCHTVNNYLDRIRNFVKPEHEDNVIRALFAIDINRSPEFLPPFERRIVVVADQKYQSGKFAGHYWRGKEVHRDERMEFVWENYAETEGVQVEDLAKGYKGTRGEKSEQLLNVIRIGFDYCRSYFPTFSEEGFEADDIAGAVYRRSRDYGGVCRDRHIFLSTIDCDWHQLVDEDHGVFWANTRIPRPRERFQDRLRSNEQVIYHTLHKAGHEIGHPSELAAKKVVVGDSGDNLPPGSPIEYFDLCEAHPRYQIEKCDWYAELVEALDDPTPNWQPEHMRKANSALVQAGIEPIFNIG